MATGRGLLDRARCDVNEDVGAVHRTVEAGSSGTLGPGDPGFVETDIKTVGSGCEVRQMMSPKEAATATTGFDGRRI